MDSRVDRIEEQPVADTTRGRSGPVLLGKLAWSKVPRLFRVAPRIPRAASASCSGTGTGTRIEGASRCRVSRRRSRGRRARGSVCCDVERRVAADSSKQQALREAGRASRIASAERVEAARRAEAAAVAEAAARRAEREIAEAHASARRQAARYSDSEIRVRRGGMHKAYQVPGEISDPYVPHPHLQSPPLPPERTYERPATQRSGDAATWSIGCSACVRVFSFYGVAAVFTCCKT